MIHSRIRNLSINNKLLLTVLFPGVAALLVAGIILLALEVGEFKQSSEEDLMRLATIIGSRSSAALLFQDTSLVEENLSVLNLQTSVQEACLYDANGVVFAKLIKNKAAGFVCPAIHDLNKTGFSSTNKQLTVVHEIIDKSDKIGTILIRADFSQAYWRKLQFTALLFLVLVAVSAMAFFLSSPLIKLISFPIAKLMEKVNAISETKDYSLRADKVHNDEIGVLVDAFNELIVTVQNQNQALTRAKDRYLALYDDNPTMVFNLTRTGAILSVNMTGARHLGVAVEALQDCFIYDFVHPNDVTVIRSLISDCLTRPLVVHKQEMRQVCHNGRIIWVRAAGRLIENDSQQNSLLLVCEDVTEAHNLSEQIAYQASHDALTGLANRSEFDRLIKEAVTLAHSDNSEHVLCYLDLDQFKIVNDTCGHLAGDELLRQLADLLKKHIRRYDFVARLGGDEFGILMYNCNLAQAFLECEKIRDVISDFRFLWENRQFAIGVSIGISSINDASGNAVNLLKEADAACYAAKDKGRNRVHAYRPDDEELATRHGEMQWVTKIRQGLEEDRFCLYGQPIIPVTKQEEGLHFETLVRYQANKNTIIPPGAFLPAAERYNLAPAMDLWVIRNLFKWLATEPGFLDKLAVCSLNLSGLSLSDENMLAFIFQQFNEWEIPTEKICFEITETAVISNLSYATKFISQLRDKGCAFSLDDFGSGLSSFAYLKNLPVDYLKIDGVFVKDIIDDKVSLAMVRSINEVGHIMGKKTVAEFVENEQILLMLDHLGVDYAQGYHISKPVPLKDLKLFIPSQY